MKHSSREDGRPGFYFFVNDWLAAGDLAICSFAAQGLWIRLLCYMWLSPKRGYLLQSNMAKMDSKMIAKLTGGTEEEISTLLAELKINNVLEEYPNGIGCRRMVGEQELSQIRKEAGIKGLSKRWHKKYSKMIANVDSKTIAETGKVRIGKDKYLEFVYLSSEEFKKLGDRFGKGKLDEMIERLNNYIGSKGVKYKSHYHTILNWAGKDETEHKETKKPDGVY